MIIGILKEERKGETRVAAVPDTVKKYTAAGFEVLVEKEAGQSAGFPDEFYRVAGGNIVSREKILRQADILIKIWCLPKKDFLLLHAGQILIADMETYHHPEYAQSLSALGVVVLALEKMPRISRAQGMDILSSQSNLAGYKAAILAVDLLNRGTALMMTPAGTIAPAKALILGAGVAGLQAASTLKRLGAVVYVSDVRAAAKEQAESLGVKFLTVDANADFENKKGYAAGVSRDFLLRQKRIVAEQLKQTDILITTAFSAGKKAPLLADDKMLAGMPGNPVVVDISGGNVAGKNLRPDIVFIQDENLATKLPNSASRLFSGNVWNLISTYGGTAFNISADDEIMAAIRIVKPQAKRRKKQ